MGIIVISDLHASSGALDDFDSELEGKLCEFLEEQSRGTVPVEFVINGDFLDFVQAEPWEGKELSSYSPVGHANLCFTEPQSLQKLKRMYQSHGELFGALGRFLAIDPRHTITILPGNHDPDFFFKEVRREFKQLVGSGLPLSTVDRLRFRLETTYRPDGANNVVIEHGHQYDAVNSFEIYGQPRWSEEYPPIFQDRAGQERLLECTGTRFLLRYLNRLDRDYHYIDNVKPFSRFLSIFGASALVPRYGLPLGATAVWDMLRYLAATGWYQPEDLLGASPETKPSDVLLEGVRHMTPDAVRSFQKRLAERGFPELEMPLEMFLKNSENGRALMAFLSDQLDMLEELQSDPSSLGAGGTGDELALSKAFGVDETKVLREAADRWRKRDSSVDTVVMGHTHESVNEPALGYFNTGCWTRYYRFSPDERIRDWGLLRDPSYREFPYQLNYVEITPGSRARAEFRTFKIRDS